ncbi:DUF2231 domain-containing protein [Novilysobacter arseniciresistens]|uniref:DUF2231 domain-containing protein n=1 Tax=Novilysobacter arseniciresistens TaxID=1385522 RepID=UPI0009DC968D|nr:DUF2231 domain-containing protein [Lysobacter arseniciresistens]
MKPIHPMLVHFPIALLVFSVSADGAAYVTRIESLGSTGWWTLLGAAISALAAVAAGLFDMYRAHRTGLSEEVHHRVHRHRLVGFALLVAILALAFWRWMLFDGDRSVPMLYLDAAMLTVALAALQGWLGGELVYSDGVFVQSRPACDEVGGSDKEHGDGHGHRH